jgi:hypothetical protein
VTSNAPSRTDGTPLTLSDADITSERAVTRRSLLGALGLSAGVAAAVAFSTSDSAPAADSDKVKDGKSKKKAPPKEEADSD